MISPMADIKYMAYFCLGHVQQRGLPDSRFCVNRALYFSVESSTCREGNMHQMAQDCYIIFDGSDNGNFIPVRSL
jgi:hypothetical protein